MSRKGIIQEIMRRDDVMSLDEANIIASDVRDTDGILLLDWLTDVIMCDGTNNEAKLAAIIRGILLSRENES